MAEDVENKEKDLDEKLREKIKDKITPYEWRLLRKRVNLKDKFSNFEKEFKKRMMNFLTAGFSFVAALLWRDAISTYLEKYQNLIKDMMPIKEAWFVQLATALLVTIVAVLSIMAISRFFRIED